jgi:hypothetical protein
MEMAVMVMPTASTMDVASAPAASPTAGSSTATLSIAGRDCDGQHHDTQERQRHGRSSHTRTIPGVNTLSPGDTRHPFGFRSARRSGGIPSDRVATVQAGVEGETTAAGVVRTEPAVVGVALPPAAAEYPASRSRLRDSDRRRPE